MVRVRAVGITQSTGTRYDLDNDFDHDLDYDLENVFDNDLDNDLPPLTSIDAGQGQM